MSDFKEAVIFGSLLFLAVLITAIAIFCMVQYDAKIEREMFLQCIQGGGEDLTSTEYGDIIYSCKTAIEHLDQPGVQSD